MILGGLFAGDGSFFGKHDGDIIAHRIDAVANRAFESALIGERLNAFFANWADEHLEQILRQGHADHLLRFFWDCSRGQAGRATLAVSEISRLNPAHVWRRIDTPRTSTEESAT